MKLLELPGEAAIGGADAQAERLLERARNAADYAHRLVQAVLRGEVASVPPPERHEPGRD